MLLSLYFSETETGRKKCKSSIQPGSERVVVNKWMGSMGESLQQLMYSLTPTLSGVTAPNQDPP